MLAVTMTQPLLSGSSTMELGLKPKLGQRACVMFTAVTLNSEMNACVNVYT